MCVWNQRWIFIYGYITATDSQSEDMGLEFLPSEMSSKIVIYLYLEILYHNLGNCWFPIYKYWALYFLMTQFGGFGASEKGAWGEDDN